MPYYQRDWNAVLGDKAPAPSNKKLRTVPATDQQQPKEPPPPIETHVDHIKITFKREMLKKQVEELLNAKCAEPVTEDPNFPKYAIQKEAAIFQGKYSSIFPCTNPLYGENALVCRMFQPKSMIIPENDLFLKVLRHLGKKHPSILSTMDIYADEEKHIYIFQELANRGNAYDYLRSGKSVPEKQMGKWARSIFGAMDYLGDVGIAHRSIQPKHILLKASPPDSKEIIAKLSGFRDSIVYWDPEAKDLIDQPCKQLSKRIYFGFQAPEIFGSTGEFYNPAEADIWSFGATMFYIAARVYPYNLKAPEPNLDLEIDKTVANCKLCEGAKTFLSGLLRANTNNRTRFDGIPHDGWFKSA